MGKQQTIKMFQINNLHKYPQAKQGWHSVCNSTSRNPGFATD